MLKVVGTFMNNCQAYREAALFLVIAQFIALILRYFISTGPDLFLVICNQQQLHTQSLGLGVKCRKSLTSVKVDGF